MDNIVYHYGKLLQLSSNISFCPQLEDLVLFIGGFVLPFIITTTHKKAPISRMIFRINFLTNNKFRVFDNLFKVTNYLRTNKKQN
jgi:hypothetical protein